jgi:hypothetical protein
VDTVGVAGFEPTAPRSQSGCATKLRHTPWQRESRRLLTAAGRRRSGRLRAGDETTPAALPRRDDGRRAGPVGPARAPRSPAGGDGPRPGTTWGPPPGPRRRRGPAEDLAHAMQPCGQRAGELDVVMALADRVITLDQRARLYPQSQQSSVMRAFSGSTGVPSPSGWPTYRATSPEPTVDPVTSWSAPCRYCSSGRPAGAAVTTEQGGFAPMPVPGDLLSLTCWQAEIATEPATVPDANLDRSLLVRLADDLLPLGRIEVPGASALWLDLGRGRGLRPAHRLRRDARPLARARLGLAELLARAAPTPRSRRSRRRLAP